MMQLLKSSAYLTRLYFIYLLRRSNRNRIKAERHTIVAQQTPTKNQTLYQYALSSSELP